MIRIKYSFKENLQTIILFILIFGNILIGKPFASINIFNFFYISEVFFGLYILLNFKNINKIFYFIFLSLLPPLFQIYFKDLAYIEVFRDYALFYYPFIIFILIKYDSLLNKSLKIIFLNMEKFFPYFPMYFFATYTLFKPLRTTEIVAICILVFNINEFKKYRKIEYFVYYFFLFIFILQNRASMLVFLLITILFLLTNKYDKSQLIILFTSFLLCLVTYSNIVDGNSSFKSLEEILSRNIELSFTEIYVNDEYRKGWSNIEFRLVLWKASLFDLYKSNNYLIKNDLGIDIVARMINLETVPKQWYLLANMQGLRSLHNSFLTFLYRFGLIPFAILTIAILKKIWNLVKIKKYYYLYPFILLIQTFFDPIIDGPVYAIPYFFILFYIIEFKTNYKMLKNEK